MPVIPIDSTIIFPTAATCRGCHGFDANGHALVDGAGNDVNIYDDWRSTMMANSAKDPFWRAKVSHEVLLFPQYSDEIQTKCTSCHAPNGHYTAMYRGHEHYTLADLVQDTIGLDGVTCSTCHKISEENFAGTNSGVINFDTNRVVYGPYYLPFAPPMEEFVGFKPLLGQHISEAGLCAPCHTLITQPFDNEGQPTGHSFVEQATYHEWVNSTYKTQNITCQECHVPRIKDPVVISANYLFLEGRYPFGLHELAGANTMMLQLMKNNKEALGIEAGDDQFDATIEATMAMLQQKSLQLSLTVEDQTADSITFALRIVNRAGHKFPSGYPSRRAFVSFVVQSEFGDTIFQSGVLQPNLEITGQTGATEPHHNIINNPQQAQIYEMVVGDINHIFTTVLERGYDPIKDNRIPPAGFSTAHYSYDTTRIVGAALQDPDFNLNGDTEGTGADIVHYRISIEGFQGLLSANATIFYQSLPPRWMTEIFASSTPEIETFRTMFDSADKSAVAVANTHIDDVYVDGTVPTKEILKVFSVNIAPNPVIGSTCNIAVNGATLKEVKVYDGQGRLLATETEHPGRVNLPGKGLFLVEIITDRGKLVKKVIHY